MPDTHNTLRTVLNKSCAPAHSSFVEKKSEFIGDICHVTTLDDAVSLCNLYVYSIPKRVMWRMLQFADLQLRGYASA